MQFQSTKTGNSVHSAINKALNYVQAENGVLNAMTHEVTPTGQVKVHFVYTAYVSDDELKGGNSYTTTHS